MSKLLVKMLAALFAISLSFAAAAAEPADKTSTDGAPKGQGATGANATTGSDYSQQRGVTGGSSGNSRADVQAEYKSAVADCNNSSGKAKKDCMKKAAKHRDKMMSSMKKGETGAAGRSGAASDDAAPIGEKPSNPTSQGSSELNRLNKKESPAN